MTTLRAFATASRDRVFVLPLGIGNAFSTRFYNASFLVIAGGVVVLVDAPAPLGKMLREALARVGMTGDLGDIDHVFLTHLHGDHCNGIEELGFWRFFVGRTGKPSLHLLEENVEPLWERRLSAAMADLSVENEPRLMILEDYFEVVPFPRGGRALAGVAGVEVETFPTRHGLPTAAFRLSAAGVRLGYSADTPFDPELIAFLSPCDLMIHETSLGAIHTPYEKLAALEPALRQRMRLIHLGDDFDLERSVIKPLREGELHEVVAR